MRITVAVVVILALGAVSWADNPGIKARITNRGLDLVLRSAIKSAKEEVRRNTPRLSTKEQDTSYRGFFYLGHGALYWPKLIGGSFGSASLKAVGNSRLRLSLNRAAMKISLKTGLGGFDDPNYLVDRPLSPYDISFDMNFYIKAGVKRIPQVTYGTCRISQVKFNKTFPHLASASGDTMKGKLEAGGCRLIGKFINGTLNDEIGRATSPATIWKGTTNNSPKTGKRESVKIELMYKFAKKTSYRNNYVDVFLTGDVYQDGKVTKKQFTPAAFPANAPVNKMLYFWLSEAVYNNIFNVAHDRKIFKRWIGPQTEIKTAAPPTVSFTTSGVSFQVTLSASTITDKKPMSLAIDATLELKEKTITTAVTDQSLKFKNIEGYESMKTAMGEVGVEFVTRKLTPIKLPLPDNMKLLRGVITAIDGSIMIGADAEIRTAA